MADDRFVRDMGRVTGRMSGINLHDDVRITDETEEGQGALCRHQMHLFKALQKNRAEYKSVLH